MSRLVRAQLIAFVLVTVVGLTYGMVQYAGLPRLLGFGTYQVSVEMPGTGGLYADADVTERGVTVGRVTSVRVHGTGILASVSLNSGTRIPADGLEAAVQNTSAVGEQYLEFTPTSARGPYLRSGSVVPKSEVSLPPSPTALLDNLNTFLESVPRKQLSITINELYKAFNGSGPELQRLLSSSGQLLTAAQANLSPTSALIKDLQPVLGTQSAHSADITALSRNLSSLSGQLKSSDSDLRGTLSQLPGTVSELNSLVAQIQPTVPLLLANLTSVGQVLNVYLPGERQTLVILPAAVNNLDAALLESGVPGSAKADFAVEVNNPTPCEQGYSTPIRDPSETKVIAPPNPTPHCTASSNSAQDVRGARNDPCPNNPAITSATAAGCDLYFGDTAKENSGSGGSGTGYSAGTYDPGSGLLVGPDGTLYSAGSGTVTGAGPTTFPELMKQTLGQ